MSKPEMPEEVLRYANWHKAAYGWNPFEPVKCSGCGNEVDLILVYRCYDCDSLFCKPCLIRHCHESRESKMPIPDGDRLSPRRLS